MAESQRQSHRHRVHRGRVKEIEAQRLCQRGRVKEPEINRQSHRGRVHRVRVKVTELKRRSQRSRVKEAE